ncbi:hypothetical protein KI688_000465 [Linnemannia hyalina]|uniref:Translation initiation factor 3 N-terminal domain-containing protein n=1 Tax=Linnemannia hyalina TaxID=64524 RepID=A0A9P7Y6W8_9FUNG|nr:hypothetical protein KI688_000465 [Linnemannia hyalina]
MATMIPFRRTAFTVLTKTHVAPYTTRSSGAAFLNTLDFLAPTPSQPRSTNPSNSSNFRPNNNNGGNKSSNREFLRNSGSINGILDGLNIPLSGAGGNLSSSPNHNHNNNTRGPLKRPLPGSAAGSKAAVPSSSTSINNTSRSKTNNEKRSQAPLDRPRRDEEIECHWIQFVGPEGNEGEKRLSSVLKTFDRSKYFLIEVDSGAQPPICKLFSKKELYEKAKAAKQAKKSNELSTKELQLNWGTDAHDLEHKLAKFRAFLEKGHRLEIQVNGKKGKSTTPQERGLIMERIKNEFEPVSKYVKQPEWVKATTVTMLLQGTPKKVEKHKKKQEQQEQQQQQ